MQNLPGRLSPEHTRADADICHPPDLSLIYRTHRDYVLKVLGRRCDWMDPSDHEALFHEAFTVLLTKYRADTLDLEHMSDSQVRAYLTQASLNKAMDEGKRVARHHTVPLETGIDAPDPAAALPDIMARSFAEARVREIIAELPARQQAVIKLRFLLGATPDTIQASLHLTERAYRHELERASRHIASRYAQVRDGTFCSSRRSTILAYTNGIAGPQRRSLARRHLKSCPACAADVRAQRSPRPQAA